MADPKEPDDFADVQSKIKAMRTMREKIDIAIDKILNKGEMTIDDVSKYLDNPKNFTESQFKLIRMYRDHLKARFIGELDPKLSAQQEKTKLKKAKKKRSRKSLGHRRKWIQMD